MHFFFHFCPSKNHSAFPNGYFSTGPLPVYANSLESENRRCASFHHLWFLLRSASVDTIYTPKTLAWYHRVVCTSDILNVVLSLFSLLSLFLSHRSYTMQYGWSDKIGNTLGFLHLLRAYSCDRLGTTASSIALSNERARWCSKLNCCCKMLAVKL